jgi:excisionase family DNA binding protein
MRADLDPTITAPASRATATARTADADGSYDPGGPDHAAVAVAPLADAAPSDADATDASDVVNVEAIARLLRVGRNTVYTLVARNAIPHRRLGKQIRFSRAAIMRWLASWSSQGAKEGH